MSKIYLSSIVLIFALFLLLPQKAKATNDCAGKSVDYPCTYGTGTCDNTDQLCCYYLANGPMCSQNPNYLTPTPTSTTPIPTTLTLTPTPTSTTPIPTDVCPGGICSTAIGPMDASSPEKFVGTLFGIILGLSGGIALILIIVSGYNLMFSQGNAEKVQGARETLTSAIVGLLFIILSLVILQVIGVDILHIPGIGG